MGKPHPMELRTRVIDLVEEGNSHRATAAHLRHDKIDATGIISGPMDREMFDLYVEGILAPTVRPGDVVLLDNLPAHRSTVAANILKEIGAWFLFLTKHSPYPNPIEMAFSKLKALIRKVSAYRHRAARGLMPQSAKSYGTR